MCTDTAGVVRTVHGEFMWPFTARVNEKAAPIERIEATLARLLDDLVSGRVKPLGATMPKATLSKGPPPI